MMSYWQLLLLILPVFALIALGATMRRLRWLTEDADRSLLKMVVSCLYPCLIFENVFNNAALRVPSNLVFAPVLGLLTMSAAIWCALFAGKLLGFEKGHGLRTFAFATGINNYGYIPLPLMQGLFGAESLGLLLVYNVGCEIGVWTVGILVLSGVTLREGWRRLINPPVIAMILALTANLSGLGRQIPSVVLNVIHQCAVCAIPIGLMLVGATIEQYLAKPRELFEPRLSLAALALRLMVFPCAFLVLAKFLPCSPELKRVLIVQSAMPAGILPIVIATHYGGHPLTAARVVIGTTLVGIFSIPLWLRIGLAWVG